MPPIKLERPDRATGQIGVNRLRVAGEVMDKLQIVFIADVLLPHVADQVMDVAVLVYGRLAPYHAEAPCLEVEGRPDVIHPADVWEEKVVLQALTAEEGVLRVEGPHLIGGHGEPAGVEVALGRVLHAADRIDVGITVPKVGLHIHLNLFAALLAIIALRDELEREAPMPKRSVIGGTHRVEGGQVGFVVAHFDVLADQEITPPTFERNVVVVYHRHYIGVHVLGPEEP